MAPPGVAGHGVAGERAAPTTPRKGGRSGVGLGGRRKGMSGDEVEQLLETFTRDFGISLSLGHYASPSKTPRTSGHEIIEKVRFLYFTDLDALDRVVENLRTCTPKVADLPYPLEFVLEQVRHSARSVKAALANAGLSQRVTPFTSTDLRTTRAALTAEPPSPTLAVKHAPKGKPPEAFTLDGAPPENAGVPSAKTSFATTSFMSDSARLNKSFMSAGTKVSQSTAATSFDGAEDLEASSTTQDSDLLASSIPSSEAMRLESEALGRDGKCSEGFRAPAELEQQLSPSRSAPTRPHMSPSLSKPVPAIAPPAAEVNVSPKREHHRIRQIPVDGLCQMQLPGFCLRLPVYLRVEVHRVLQVGVISPEQLDGLWQPPRNITTLHQLADRLDIHFNPGYETDFEDATLSAKLQWNTSSEGPLLRFELQRPVRDQSSALQRKFGADRILYVDLPPLKQAPQGFAFVESQEAIKARVMEMIGNDHWLLGRKWVHFLVQEKKRKKSADPDSIKPGAYQLFFFAVGGDDDRIPRISIVEFLNWPIPFRENKDSSSCKAYARLDLSSSRTTPVLQLHPDQIDYDVADQCGDDTPEDHIFNDPNPAFDFCDRPGANAVMSDGCAMIARKAMDDIERRAGFSQRITWIQARIGAHAKGIWFVGPDTINDGNTASNKVLEIRRNQIKVKRGEQDFTDKYDPDVWTINMVRHSGRPRTSVLHIGFLPILVDREVPFRVIRDVVHRQVSAEAEEVLAALQDPVALRRWLNAQSELNREHQRRSGIPAIAEFPTALAERIIVMLESGFVPLQCRRLADDLFALMSQFFSLKSRNFKIHHGQSTTLTGIADPYGVLPPGHVHVLLSSPLEDPATGRSRAVFNKEPAICGRNPALRNSDLQKVTVVSHPALGHLQNCVVFPTRGPRPLASKLQGGDYDGDDFFLLFDQELVRPFRNSPAPYDLPEPESFGITIDKTKLQDVIRIPESSDKLPNEGDVRDWIRANTASRMTLNLLGTVTKMHEKVVYADSSISSARAVGLVDLHDHLVDADKRGFHFDGESWKQYKRAHLIPENLKEPAYRCFTEYEADKSEEFAKKVARARPNPNSIIDEIYFHVVQPIVQDTIAKAKETLRGAGIVDHDLTRFYEQTWDSECAGSVIRKELGALRSALVDGVKEAWRLETNRYTHRTVKSRGAWEGHIKKIRTHYEAIQPTDLGHPTVVEWLRPQEKDITMWEKLKVSALAKFCRSNDGKMMFHIAGNELCRLKASVTQTRTIVMQQYLALKPGKYTMAVQLEEASDDDESDDVSEFADGESLFDGYDAVSPVKPVQRKRSSSDAENEACTRTRALRDALPSSPPAESYLFDCPPGSMQAPQWLQRKEDA